MKIQKLLLLIFAVFFLKLLYAQEIEHRYLNTATYYDYWKPKLSHVSIEDKIPVQSPNSTAIWGIFIKNQLLAWSKLWREFKIPLGKIQPKRNDLVDLEWYTWRHLCHSGWMLLCNLSYLVKTNKSLFNKIINLKKKPIEKLKKATKRNAIQLNVKTNIFYNNQ